MMNIIKQPNTIYALQEQTSFTVTTSRTPYFEEKWHRHSKYELVLFIEGSGIVFAGKYIDKFQSGDVYFLGSNLLHAFQIDRNIPVKAIVIQFHGDCWNHFTDLPECREIKQILKESSYRAILPTGRIKYRLRLLIKTLEIATNFNRIILLLRCLHILSMVKSDLRKIADNTSEDINKKEPLDNVIKFTFAFFQDPITLAQVAGIASMSISVFCHYFKRCTQKTYIKFLNEVRMSYACNLLRNTNKPVAEICYESGYSTVVHFHRQFLKYYKVTPMQYRKSISSG